MSVKSLLWYLKISGSSSDYLERFLTIVILVSAKSLLYYLMVSGRSSDCLEMFLTDVILVSVKSLLWYLKISGRSSDYLETILTDVILVSEKSLLWYLYSTISHVPYTVISSNSSVEVFVIHWPNLFTRVALKIVQC